MRMLFDALRSVAASAPRLAGLRVSGRTTPYAELVERIESAAAMLLDSGVAPGTRVALLLPHSPDFFVAAYGLFAIGATAVPLNPSASARELQTAARDCGVGALVFAAGATAAAEAIDPDRRLPQLSATVEGLFAPRQPAKLPPVSGGTDAVYLFSSGSTGRPKVVPHTHEEMLADGLATTAGLELTPDDVILNALPGHHAFGFMNAQFEAVAAGATTLYWSDPQPLMLSRGRLLAALAEEGVTVLPGVPFLFDTLAGWEGAVDLSRVRLCYSSGVGLRAPVHERFRGRFGIGIRQAYGSTETGLAAANCKSTDPAPWDSVGAPVGDASVEVVGEGELLIRSSSLTRGYLNAEAANRAAFVDGGLLTGDLGHLDAAGNVYITGRSKLILEVAGHKIDPVEVEDVLADHPAVAEAVVVGVPSPRTGEQRLKAVVVRRGEATADALQRHCRERLSVHKVPELIEFRDEIPRSAAGKVLRGKLMED